VIELAGQPVLLLFDEVLNALTRHKWLAEPMHAFIHNIGGGQGFMMQAVPALSVFLRGFFCPQTGVFSSNSLGERRMPCRRRRSRKWGWTPAPRKRPSTRPPSPLFL